MKKTLLSLAVSLTLGLQAQTPVLTLTQVANITTTPSNKVTCIANCGDGRLFFTEAPGRIKFFDPYAGGVTTATTFMDIVSRVKSTGNEQGLLGLAFAPDFATSGRFYVNYTNTTGIGNTTVSRFTISSANAGNPASEEILFTVTQPYSNHNGGNIAFGPDGYLYIGMGDGGSANDPNGNGQNGATRLGKMLRIDVSGATGYSIPPSNPFLEAGDNILDEIWAIGVRNPWRYSFDRLTGDLWIADVGQNLYEEVNLITAPDTGGQNYGWRCHEGLHDFSSGGCTVPNRTDPVFEYTHSASNGCSITGGFVNRGNLYDALYGRYFVTDYCSGRIWSLIPNGLGGVTSYDHGAFVTNKYTTFGEDAYGEVYIAEQTGKISRLTTAEGSPMALISLEGPSSFCQNTPSTLSTGFNPLLTYQWYNGTTAIAGATTNTYLPNVSGNYKVEVTRAGAPSAMSDSIAITVFEVPELSASALVEQLCADAAFPIALNGTPAGGTFSGTGVTDQSFNPFQLGPGNYMITYDYTTSDGCVAVPASFPISIYPLPTVSLNGLSASLCIDSAPEIPVGTPDGGMLSGPGISSGTFDPAIAGVGTHSVSYTYADANGCAASASASVVVEACLSIDEATQLGIQVLPNPFHGKFNVRFSNENEQFTSVEVFSLNGQRVYAANISASIQQTLEIDLSAYSAGSYFLRLNGTSKQHTIQLIQE